MNNFIITINPTTLLKTIEEPYYKKNLPEIKIGCLIKIGILIIEGNKERNQFYEGIVIAKNNGGINRTFTVRRIIQGVGVERIFLIHSPKITSLVVNKFSYIRRSKLYYLRQLSGKAARLKQQFG
jgi:large subunit ribosomal protein L19